MPVHLPDSFSSIVKTWFDRTYPAPTEVQLDAWPHILNGEHVLVSAPTGSGKTLTAFLCGINALLTKQWPTDRVSLLYISPLKALNNDIERNLLAPLSQIEELARERNTNLPEIRVATRSGDTPSSKRRSMIRRPPAILITTPESLNLILSSPRARTMLGSVRTVILDEIHAVVGEKRGTHLITAVERVALLAGEFQRIALSATVRPMDLVAAFVAGVGPNGPRPVRLIESAARKLIELSVRFPDTDEPTSEPGFWPHLGRELMRIIECNQSTLIFVNTRRHAEKITLLLNEGRATPVAYSHHGSLSRELREFVEHALKAGELRAIVATNSLELGIDIGTLDQVVLVGTPPEIRSTLQRIGRAGHQVGAVSRAVLFPLHGRDLIDAVAMGEAVAKREVERVEPVRGALDVLAQVIISMTTVETWRVDALYTAIRSSYPYAELPREHFDLVLEMLAGRYQETRIAELKPRIRIDRVLGTVRARDEARLLLYASGGTIPDRGYFQMRSADGSRIGELDEEFVWERRVGESFTLGSQVWTIEQITEKDVVVRAAKPGSPMIPFWRAFSRGRHPFYASRVLSFLSACENATQEGRLEAFAENIDYLEPDSTRKLCDVVVRQRAHTNLPLPHEQHVVLELLRGQRPAAGAAQESMLVVHTLRGLAINMPIALALETYLQRRGEGVSVNASNDSLALQTEAPSGIASPFSSLFSREICNDLAKRGVLDELLRSSLESSSIFGALFRENAGRALLLPKAGFGKRMPLWLNRRRSKRIIEAVAQLHDFPIMIETWRSCLEDHFDVEAARSFLARIASGEIRLGACTTDSPSPFAQDVMWQHTNVAMYESEARSSSSVSETSSELIRRIVHSPDLRPDITPEIVEQARVALAQTAPGHAPSGGEEIVDWVDERVVVPVSEIALLRAAVMRDHGAAAWHVEAVSHQLTWLRRNGCVVLASANRSVLWEPVYHDGEIAPVGAGPKWDVPPSASEPWSSIGAHATLLEADGLEECVEVFLAEVLQSKAPITRTDLENEYGFKPGATSAAIADLVESGSVICGELVERDSRSLLCHADVLEYLLRLRRSSARPAFEPVCAEELVAHWAVLTGATNAGDNPDRLVSALDALFAYPARAELWETDILPARTESYFPTWLDGLLAGSELVWFGCGNERTAFALYGDLELVGSRGAQSDLGHDEQLIRNTLRRMDGADTFAIRDQTHLDTDATVAALWQLVWAGQVSNTSYETLRAGIKARFAVSSLAAERDSSVTRWPGRRARS
ncbi:MAG: DEAD/DEAH box helicase, partial [Spirochaetales bacterium]